MATIRPRIRTGIVVRVFLSSRCQHLKAHVLVDAIVRIYPCPGKNRKVAANAGVRPWGVHAGSNNKISPAKILRRDRNRTQSRKRKEFSGMKQHYLSLSDDPYIFERAVLNCFDGKYRRNDVLSFIEKYSGIPRHEVLLDELVQLELKPGESHYPKKLEIARDVGVALEEIVQEILNGFEPEDMKPVCVRKKKDGVNGKMRDIALLCITHQLVEHLTFNLLEPLLKAKIKSTQHASIPGHGQTALKRQVFGFLQNKSLNIAYARKTDIQGAYKNTLYSRVIIHVKRDIPSAKDIIVLLEWLRRHAPGGHLIIGGYLDAWLFNYMMSNFVEKGYTYGGYRRSKCNRYAKKIVTFMDDGLILASSRKGLKIVCDSLSHFARDALGLTMRFTSGILEILSKDEERSRKLNPYRASKGCTAIDMGGFRIFRTHLSIRKSVFIRVRRTFTRAYKEYLNNGTIRIQRARRLLSHYGFIVQTDSKNLMDKYHVNTLVELAKRVVSFDSRKRRRKRLEELYDLRERTINNAAKYLDNGTTSRRFVPDYPYKECA